MKITKNVTRSKQYSQFCNNKFRAGNARSACGVADNSRGYEAGSPPALVVGISPKR
jgi:hypothetical protein